MMYRLSLIALFCVSCSSSQKAEESNPSAISSVEVEAPAIEVDSEEPSAPIKIESPKRSYKEDIKAAYDSRNEASFLSHVTGQLSKNPNDTFTLNYLAAHHYRKGAIKLARMIWERSIKAEPKNTAALNNIGATYHKEDEEVALGFYKKALSSNTRHPYANYNMGSIYVKYKNFSMAETTLRVAYSSLKNKDVMNNYALALKGNGKAKDSLKVYEEVYRSNPDDLRAILNYAGLLVETKTNASLAKEILNRARLMGSDRSTQKYINDLDARLSK